MRHNAIVTISSYKGSKVIRLGLIGKLSILFILISLALGILIGLLSLYLLTQEVNELENNYHLSLEEYNHFTAFINELTQQIHERDSAFSDLAKIETLIGIENVSEDISFAERINTTKHSFLQRSFILQNIPSGYPFAEKVRISSSYGKRIHPIKKNEHFHKGTDFAAGHNREILATAAGVIESVFYDKDGYGRMIRVRHDFGFTTVYAHLAAYKVKRGDYVNKGDVIALSGSSGLSTGPHLHYEVRYLGRPLNPIHFVKWNLSDYPSIFTKVKGIKWSKLIQNVKQKTALQEQLLSPTDLELAAN